MLSSGIEIPFTNGFYSSGRSEQFSSQRCINWYPAIAKKPALSAANLYMTPGLRSIIDSTAGVNRGAVKFDGKPYFVNGNKLYRLDQTVAPDLTETYAAVEVGTIGGTGRVIMAAGQLDLVVVVPDQFSYSWNDGTSTFTALDSLPNFRTARDVVHINSLFIFLESNSNFLFQSGFNDPTTYSALGFEQVFQITEGIGLVSYRNQLYVMGDTKTIPFVYQPVGLITDSFYFVAQPRAEIDIGLRSVFAKMNIRQSVMFLGGGENEESGLWIFPQMVKISTETIDYIIQNLSDFELSESFMLKHAQNDSEAVSITIGDWCFVYDMQSGAFHERRSRVNGSSIRWRVNSIVQAYNRIFAFDYIDGRVGIIDDQINTEYGEEVYREVSLQPFDANGKYLRLKSLLLMMDTGFGGDISLIMSMDGITDLQAITLSSGDSGEYGHIVEFDQLGTSDLYRKIKLTTNTVEKCNINKVIARL